MAVVVEAAHQAGIELEGDLQGLEAGLHLLKTLAAFRSQGVGQGGGPGEQGLGAWVLAVEDAQGVAH